MSINDTNSAQSAVKLNRKEQETIEEQEIVEGFIEDADELFNWKDVGVIGWLCIPAFWVLAGVVFFQFFTRYFLNDSAVWTEEVARYILVVLVFFGAAYALRTGAHISVEYFLSLLPKKPKRFIEKLNSFLEAVFYGIAAYLCLGVADATKFQKLMSVDLSKSIIYYAVCVAFIAMLLLTLRGIFFKRHNDAHSIERSE